MNAQKWLTSNCQSGIAQKEGLIIGNLSQVTYSSVRGGVSGRAQPARYPPVWNQGRPHAEGSAHRQVP